MLSVRDCLSICSDATKPILFGNLCFKCATPNGTLQTDIAEYANTGSASYVTAFNQNFSIIEEKVLQNRIYLLDSIINIVLAVIVLLWMNPVISIAAMAVPGLLPRFFTKVLGKATGKLSIWRSGYSEKCVGCF